MPNGQEFDLNNFEPTEIVGSSGLKQSGGFIFEEFYEPLRGPEGIKIYREMQDNNSIIGSYLYAIKSLVRQVDWFLDPANDSNEAMQEKEWYDGALFDDMEDKFLDRLDESLSMIPFGWAVQEIIYKVRKGPDSKDPSTHSMFSDGRFGWRKWEIRAQDSLDRWEFDEDGKVVGMHQIDVFGVRSSRALISLEKALHFRTDVKKGNPEGKSLLRPAVVSYQFLKRLQEIEAIGTERELAGMPVYEVPLELLLKDANDADKALLAQIKKQIMQVKRNDRFGGVVPTEQDREGKPTGYKFKLLNTGGKRQIDTDTIIKRYEQRIAMTMLAEFLLLGMDKVGSFALASTKTDLFASALGSILDEVVCVINGAIKKLHMMNNRPMELMPKLSHGDIEPPPVDELSKLIVSMSQAGFDIGNDPDIKRKLLKNANLPVPPEEEDPAFEEMPPGIENPDGLLSFGDATIMASEQTRIILEINASLKKKEIEREAAIELIASSLGIKPDEAEKFVGPEPPETPDPPPVLPPVPSPGGEEIDEE